MLQIRLSNPYSSCLYFRIHFIVVFLCLYTGLCIESFGQQINTEFNSIQRTIENNGATTLRIAPETAIGGDASLFLDEVDYIPLETTPVSEFGTIDQLEITEDYFFVLDGNTDCILIFTKHGKFHTKISKDGRPNDSEYFNQIKQFSIDRNNKEIVIKCRRENLFLFYDFNGKFLRKFNAKGNPGEFQFFNDGSLISFDSYNNLLKDNVVWSKKEHINGNTYVGDFLKNLDPRDIVFGSETKYLYNFPSEDSFFMTIPYDYQVYSANTSKIEIKYNFVFPIKNSLPKDFCSDKKNDLKRRQYINQNKQVVYVITNFYQLGDNILFKINSDIPNIQHLVLNLKSQNLISLQLITPDSISSYLTIAQPISAGAEFANKGILNVDNGYMYTSYSSMEMFRSKDEAKDKVIVDPVLKKYFLQSNSRSNPIIVKMKLKNNL